MPTKIKPVTKTAAEKVLGYVAEYLATKGYGTPICPEDKPLDEKRWYAHTDGTDCEDQTYGPAPTGPEAQRNGEGPMLLMAWDWPSFGPTPSVILEGGPYDWAIECTDYVQDKINAAGLNAWVEPHSGWALCVHRKD